MFYFEEKCLNFEYVRQRVDAYFILLRIHTAVTWFLCERHSWSYRLLVISCTFLISMAVVQMSYLTDKYIQTLE